MWVYFGSIFMFSNSYWLDFCDKTCVTLEQVFDVAAKNLDQILDFPCFSRGYWKCMVIDNIGPPNYIHYWAWSS